MNCNIALLFLFFFSFDAIGHQDRIIKYNSNGHLDGLPDKYLPAYFDSKKWALTISGSDFTFPACVENNLSDIGHSDLFFTSSWYHVREPRMPNYLNIEVKSKGFSVLVALDTARPFGLNKLDFKELAENEICALLK
jgi:hypothetical protein